MNVRRAALLVALAVAASGPSAAPAAAADTFSYSGDSVRATLAKGSERAVLTGHATVRSDDVLISADEIQLLGKNFPVALATGRVHVVDAKRGIDLTASDLWYDRTAKIARIRGNAEMADRQNEIVVKGGFLEDRDTEGLTIIQIGVRIFHKDLVCRAEFAKYWRDKKLLELTGMPWVSRKGDEYRAAKITINLDTEEIVLEGSVKGTAAVEEKKSGPGEETPSGGNGAPQPPEGEPGPGSGEEPPSAP